MIASGNNEDGERPRRKPRKPTVGEVLQRQPPFDLEAEMGVLGSILLLPEVCDDIASLLRADDFYDDANRCLVPARS
jgi:replicative DNA helicase